MVKEGVNQNEEITKKYGVLERSLNFELLKSRSNIDFLELQERQNSSCNSSASYVSGMSIFSAND